jgi:hypothetical protein
MKKLAVFQMVMVLFLCVNLAVPPGLMAQGAKEEAAKQEGPSFRPEEIDQMVAPIALYPDSLLAQVFVASTYPLEVVQAAKFAQQNKDLKGEKLLAAAKDKEWDPSVKAMLSFPDVLAMMSDKLEWTEKLGNAFLDQQKEVMASVQRLRQKAQESGNLKTTKEQKVIVEKETKVIVVESASPQVVYVPTYNPTVVYGAWAYPAYPPAPVYPPGYVATAGLAFAAGVAVGAAAGYGGWGCGWGNNEININNSTTNNFTKNNYNNPQKYQNKGQTWQHNPEHRGNAQYKNQKTAQKYGQQRSGGGARAGTSEARGYGGGAGEKGGGRAQTSDVSRGSGTGARGGTSAQTSDASRGGGKESALSGSGKGGGEREASNRGNESRSSASRSGGGSRSSSGGGGSRGGGSRSGGGGGGRGGGR